MANPAEHENWYASRGRSILELEMQLWDGVPYHLKSVKVYIQCHKVAVYCVDNGEVDKAEELLNSELNTIEIH